MKVKRKINLTEQGEISLETIRERLAKLVPQAERGKESAIEDLEELLPMLPANGAIEELVRIAETELLRVACEGDPTYEELLRGDLRQTMAKLREEGGDSLIERLFTEQIALNRLWGTALTLYLARALDASQSFVPELGKLAGEAPKGYQSDFKSLANLRKLLPKPPAEKE